MTHAKHRITDPREFGRVAVLMGGTSSEREVSLDSGRNVLESLQRCGVDATAVDGIQELARQLEGQCMPRVAAFILEAAAAYARRGITKR